MFAEEEWTDALPAIKHAHAVKTGQLAGKNKTISKQCLKRTLQTLGSVPDWERTKPSGGSDGEEDHAPTPHARKKKKKCKKRKKSSGSAAEGEHGVQETPAKKRHVTPKRKQRVTAAPEKRLKPERARGTDGDKLSRQQWKNKMKNKRRSKNKFLHVSAGLGQKEETSGPASDELSLQRKTGGETRKPTSQSVTGHRKRNGTDPSVPASSAVKEAEPNQGEKQKQKSVLLEKKSQLHAKRLRHILNTHASESSKEAAEGEEGLKPESKEERNPTDRSSALRLRMVQRLESARFRYINELLYTSTSGEAKRMFRQDPDAVGIYHKGYSAQVKHWPANPVDLIVSFIQKKPSSLVVADFGCGDCKIARSVKNKVHCFDLAPVSDLVTVCDMANVPLADSTVDIVVFCLSLMGTNLTEFLAEANRVLVMGGVLKIAEVASRFDNIRQFTGALSRLGFKLVSKDTENSHFYSFEFVKTDDAPDNVKKMGLQLKPCLYKKR